MRFYFGFNKLDQNHYQDDINFFFFELYVFKDYELVVA